MTKTKKDKKTAETPDARAKVYEQPVVVNMVGKTVAAPQVLLNDRDKMLYGHGQENIRHNDICLFAGVPTYKWHIL